MLGQDITRGQDSPVMVAESGRKEDHSMMVLAVMIILVIFIFVIFAIFAMRSDKKHHDGTGIAEMAGLGLALNQANKSHGHHDQGTYAYQMAHDNMRDNLREFGNLKFEIAERSANTDAQTAQYFYQTQRDIEVSKFDNYKATKESEEKVLMAIKDSEIKRVEDDFARERENNLYHRITATLIPKAPVPAFTPQYHHQPMVSQTTVEATQGGFTY